MSPHITEQHSYNGRYLTEFAKRSTSVDRSADSLYVSLHQILATPMYMSECIMATESQDHHWHVMVSVKQVRGPSCRAYCLSYYTVGDQAAW